MRCLAVRKSSRVGFVLEWGNGFRADPNLYLGTSSWSTENWVGPFYPPDTSPVEFLTIYASHYNTVKIDSTYYSIPPRKLVRGWYDRTPDSFVFSAKFPGEITH